MAELADVQDLGSCAARRVGSTPTTRTRARVPIPVKRGRGPCFLFFKKMNKEKPLLGTEVCVPKAVFIDEWREYCK